MKFIDVCFKDKVCFIPDSKANQLNYPCMNSKLKYDDNTLCEFLNLYRQDYKLDTTLGNVESFARKHGSLMNEDWLTPIVVPSGFSCIELQNFKDKFEVDKIYYEEIDEWKKHILAFNDLSHIAYVKTYQSRLDCYNIVRYIFKNIIHFRESDGTCSYLYFGSSDFMKEDSSGFLYYLPPEVKEFLHNVGNVLVYRTKTEAQYDSIENRQNWFASHAKEILRRYQEQYLDNCQVSEVNLLGKLQNSMIHWINEKRPLSICLLCGSFFLPIGESVKSGHFCSGLCQSRFYQKREIYQDGLIQSTAFTNADFKRLFNARNRKF